jgi:hypothetical protein
MVTEQFIPRKLTEQQQLDLALKMSQYNNLDRLVLSQHDNQRRLNEAKFFDIDNEIADAQVMAKILEKAIKFSIH